MKNKTFKNTLQIIWNISKIGSIAFIVSIVGSLVFSLGNYALVYFAGKVTETAIEQASLGIFDKDPFVLLGIWFLCMIPVLIFGQIANVTGGQYAEKRLKKKMIHHILRQKESEITKGHSGDMMTLLTSDTDVVNNFYFQGINYMFFHPLASGIAALITLIVIDIRLALVSVLVGIISVLVSSRYSKTIQEEYVKARQTQNMATNQLSEILGNEEMIRLNSIDKVVTHKYNEKNKEYGQDILKAESLKHKVSLWNDSFNQVLKVSFLVIGIYLSMQGQFEFTKIMLILMLQPNISTMFGSLSQSWNFLLEISTSAHRILTMLETELENEREELDTIADYDNQLNGSIDFEEVTFGYTDSTLAIDNFTLKIPPKKTIAFVGESGSGKSTLFQLLLGFYDLDNGTIKLDGKDINQHTLASVRKQMVYVQQESPLFNVSIKENVRLGSEDYHHVKDEDIITACKKAAIHDFIMTLPEGYNTIVGENSSRLSGGQRQRIAIARAFMSKASILIMDEPTSALDSDSENLVQEALKNIRKEKTVLIAAHRLSTINDADEIVVLEKGKLVEQGNHEELMYNKNIYYNYVKTLG
ncbi:ABC transporter ATP-binding protein [Erysipelothrix urinaevulpis]|uniref:ABC transporter ATP-binding protein n=1 Tax=Erysipelothrix urinaevulpis TaxID=2683717 RepID=UPI001359A214|nr:ABC transporter ATP-binding protein [Erysipelothrix urinaevulpis]